MAYTQEGIMAQVWIAFGQGAGAIRVSHDAAMELRRWYYDAITPEVINEKWQTDAVQALDRIRAIGRLAALRAAGAGSTVIKPEDVYASASKVQAVSCTPLCPPDPADPDSCGDPGVEWTRAEAVTAGAARAADRHH
jgi:histone H3/H4